MTEPRSPEVFDEPWQARALAIAVKLREADCFPPAEWSD
jgi:hypothetical protein